MIAKKNFNGIDDEFVVFICKYADGEEWQNILSQTKELAKDNIQIVMVYYSSDEMKEQRKTVKNYIDIIPELKKYLIVFAQPAWVMYQKGKATPAFSDLHSNRYKAIKFDGSQVGGGDGMYHYFGEALDTINKDKAAPQAK